MSNAADVMTTEVITVDPEWTVPAIAQLLRERGISGVPVVDGDGRLIGIVSDADLIGHVAVVGKRPRSWWLDLFSDDSATAREYVRTHGRTARDVMTADVISVERTASLADVADTMRKHRVKRLPVVDGGRLLGIVTRGDLLRGVAALLPQEVYAGVDDQVIRDRLAAELQEQPWAHVIDIHVEGGVVHLHGTFRSDDERRALRVAAENVAGVRGVEDHLTLWSSSPIRLSGEG